MTKEIEIVCPPGQHEDEATLILLAATAANIPAKTINGIKILKRSIDARGRKVVYRMQVRLYVDEPYVPEHFNHQYKTVKEAKRVIIVGAGPAGIFAALQCIEQGLKPVILERGKDVKQRRRDLANINKQGLVNPESNYCFGEGGAGTYSDGKTLHAVYQAWRRERCAENLCSPRRYGGYFGGCPPAYRYQQVTANYHRHARKHFRGRRRGFV